MYELFYRTEVNCICLFLLAWITYHLATSQDQQTKNILFKRVMISSVLILVIETIQFLIDGHSEIHLFILNYFLSFVYLVLNGTMAYYWFVYTVYLVTSKEKTRNFAEWTAALVVILYVLILIASVFTKTMFYIDAETNTFVAGSMYFIQAILTYGLFATAAFLALMAVIRRQKLMFSLGTVFVVFVCMPLAGGIVHLIFPKAKVVWQLLAVGQMLVACDYKFSLVSIDALTSLNNRRSFNSRMAQIASEEFFDVKPTLFMIDINLFKEINDTFGHPEGDNALVQTSQLLKNVFSKSDAYLSRFGGDEFCVVYNCLDAETVKQRVYKAFDEYNQISGKPYHLSISIGYAQLVGTGKGAIDSMLKRADEDLYTEKSLAHKLLGGSIRK